MSYQRGLFAPTPAEYTQEELPMPRYIVDQSPVAGYSVVLDTVSLIDEKPSIVHFDDETEDIDLDIRECQTMRAARRFGVPTSHAIKNAASLNAHP